MQEPIEPPQQIRSFTVRRSFIEAGDTSVFLTGLLGLLDDESTVLRYRNAVEFWIEGYVEPWHITWQRPEVRQFFQAVNQEWPYWIWFLRKDRHMVCRLFWLLSPVKCIQAPGERVQLQHTHMQHLQDLIAEQMTRGLALFQAYPDIDKRLMRNCLYPATTEIYRGKPDRLG